MRLKPALQALIDAGDWGGVVQFYRPDWTWVPRDEVDWLGWLYLIATVAVMLFAAYQAIRCFRVTRPGIPFTIGTVTVDLQPKPTDTIHAAIGGFSGSGKSTVVLPLLDNPRTGVLVVALDNSRPISKKFRYHQYILHDDKYIEWTNEEDSFGYGVGLDLLTGPARNAVEVIMAGWKASSGETGKWRDIVSNRLVAIVRDLDARHQPRDWRTIASTLAEPVKGHSRQQADACQDWAARLERLADNLGPSLGTDLDLIAAMRNRQKVMLRLNRFIDPRMAPMLGGMLLVKARHVAQAAGVPFVLIVEEAGQMDAYAEHMTPLAQAGRDRQVPLVIITQNLSLLAREVVNNIKVWVVGAQEDDAEVKFAVQRLRLREEHKQDPNVMYEESFKHHARGWFYVRAPGIKRTLVRAANHNYPDIPYTPELAYASGPTQAERGATEERRTIVVEELSEPPPTIPRLGPPRLIVQELLDLIQKTETCWLWLGTLDKDGYGYKWWPPDEANRRVHRLVWAIVYGSLPTHNEAGEPLELDHQCKVRNCCNPQHLELVTKSENIRRRWEGKRKAKGVRVA